jgi:S1-C subfamily serine protease
MLQELKRLGYPLADMGKSNAFDTDVSAAPDYRVGGIIREVKFETCAIGSNAKGWAYFKISWALFSEKEQKVVLERTTEGLAKVDDRVPDILKRGLLSSIDNFLADPALLDQLKSTPVAKTGAVGSGMVSSKPASLSVADLKTLSAPKGGAQKNQAQLLGAVVTLETPSGSGSGFFIHKDGYLLTDYHVVAGAKFAKVKLSNGDKMVAEVVKINEHDDVALLKCPPIEFAPLAIRFDSADVGEPVYAIGSPLGVLTSTMTKGVLSADRKIQGAHVLQSDAAVTFGSSGGPLLDADGRVIGLAKSTLAVSQGFNLFIPIVDALQSLDITVK